MLNLFVFKVQVYKITFNYSMYSIIPIIIRH